MSFAESVKGTQCPYAGLAVWHEITVDSGLIDQQGMRVLEDVGSAVRQSIAAGADVDMDMLAIQIDHPSVVAGLDPFSRAAAQFMRGLLGPKDLPGQPGETIGHEDEWVAYVDGKRLFVFTLCPFYGESHPRRSATGSAFIVVQFIRSFRKINMHRMSLAEKKELSNRVKAVFTKAGVNYFSYITQSSVEALKLVKPLHQGDQPVRWWTTLDTAAGVLDSLEENS